MCCVNEDIADFLKDRGDVGVTTEDIARLTSIVECLVEKKWDGFRPVEFQAVDRTRFEQLRFFCLPRLDVSACDEKMLNEYIGLAAANVRLALESLTNALKIRDGMVEKELEKAGNG